MLKQNITSTKQAKHIYILRFQISVLGRERSSIIGKVTTSAQPKNRPNKNVAYELNSVRNPCYAEAINFYKKTAYLHDRKTTM